MNKILKELRKEKGVSQKEVAMAIGVTPGAYGNYEQGTREPSLDILVKICRFFNTTPNYLLGFEY